MNPVNLSVRPEDSSGGLLRVGDWVNVSMTSLITGPGLKDSPRQVVIVPNARVILKRNTLRPIYAALPTDKPVPFTIETNAYPAALAEFARDKGDFSLVALPEDELREHRLVPPRPADPVADGVFVPFVTPVIVIHGGPEIRVDDPLSRQFMPWAPDFRGDRAARDTSGPGPSRTSW